MTRVVRPETKARIIAVIQEWNDVVGRPPGAADWNTSSPKHRPRPETAYRRWPAVSGVVAVFGTWNAAIEASGFQPLEPGYRRDVEAWRVARARSVKERSSARRERRQKIAQMWGAGTIAREIAEELGLQPGSIWWEISAMRKDGWDLPRRA